MLRLKDRLMQIEIVNSADPGDQRAWETRRDPVHQRAADGAEVVLHRVAALDGFVLREFRELVAAAHVRCFGLFDDEVGGEH